MWDWGGPCLCCQALDNFNLHSCCSCSPFLVDLGEIWPLESRVYPSRDKGKPQPWTSLYKASEKCPWNSQGNRLQMRTIATEMSCQWGSPWRGWIWGWGMRGMAWGVRDKEPHREEHTQLSRKWSPWGPSCLPQWISTEANKWEFLERSWINKD